MVALTNWFSTIDRSWHIGVVDSRGHVLDLYMTQGAPSWRAYDVTDDIGPLYAAKGALTSWFSLGVPDVVPPQQHIAYIDGRGHVQEVYVEPSKPPWQIRDVTDDIQAVDGKWAQPGALTGWWAPDPVTGDPYGMRHLAYIDQRGHVQDCYMRPGEYPWGNHDVTEDLLQRYNVGDDPNVPFPALPGIQGGALAGWWSPYDNTQHVTYIVVQVMTELPPQFVMDVWVSPAASYPAGVSWDIVPPETYASLIDTPQLGALTTWTSPDHTQHVGYVQWQDNNLVEVRQSAPAPSWGAPYDVTNDMGHTAQLGLLTSWWSTIDGRQHMAYVDHDGHIQDAYVTPGQPPWGSYNVQASAGAPAPLPGPTGSDTWPQDFTGAFTSWWNPFDDTQHIAYIDVNANVQELWVHPNQPPWHWRTAIRLLD